MNAKTSPGPTLVAYFKTVAEARQCVLDLHCAGFSEDLLGFTDDPAGAVVTVLPGERYGDARRILRRDHGRQAAARPGSAIRGAVERALRRL
ncbi:MAG TPA: hypothetical protein VNG93_03390 [Candidatus Dormibacteraeota bacterium]|nr:hypothetical protein [Candidatus Dormibacteraeota bacterium]